jgi:hypothetical protein
MRFGGQWLSAISYPVFGRILSIKKENGKNRELKLTCSGNIFFSNFKTKKSLHFMKAFND